MPMRYLNRKWADGEYDEFTTDLYYSVYMRHLVDTAPELPQGARAFAMLSRGQLLAAGELVATRFDETAQSFTLILKFNSGTEANFLELEYLGVSRDTSDLEAFELADGCLTEEFDLGPEGTFEHRILLQPEGEALIRFTDLKLHAKRGGSDE